MSGRVILLKPLPPAPSQPAESSHSKVMKALEEKTSLTMLIPPKTFHLKPQPSPQDPPPFELEPSEPSPPPLETISVEFSLSNSQSVQSDDYNADNSSSTPSPFEASL